MTREWSSSALLYLILLSDLALIQVSLWPKWETVLGKHGNLPRLHIDMSMSCHGRSENPFWANMEICFGSLAHLYLHPPWANCLSDLALIQVSLWPKWETVLGKHGNLPRLHVMAEVRICFGQTWKSASAVRHTCISTLPEQTAYLILLWFKFRSGRSENPFWANMEICFGFILTCQCHVLSRSFTILLPSFSSLLFNIWNGGKIPFLNIQTTADFANFATFRTDVRLG